MALVTGSVSPTGEIHALLRQRLMTVAVLLLTGGTLGSLMRLHESPHVGGLLFLLLLSPFLTVSAIVLIVLLRAGMGLSLRALRTIELVLFGSLALSMVVMTLTIAQTGLLWCAKLGHDGMTIGGRFASMPWFTVQIVYGVCIPNTWRRCASVVTLMALAPLVIHIGIGWAEPSLEKSLLLVFLLEMSLWMGIGVAIAVFGSYHIAVLRDEAFEARKLGQYQLKQRLGAGGMGEVYLAEHVLLRRGCAVKLIRPENAGDPNNLLRFEREVRTTATLTHPNTIQIFDYGRADDGTFYYVMEYLPGLTLDHLVEQHGPLPSGRAIHFLRQLCGALREAHAVGLIHRDIKPSNVMICERGGVHDVVKLLDFGLVLPIASSGDERLTQVGLVAGTPAFMSPEQASGKEVVDARSDIYAIGALAYFLLTGKSPFAGRTPMQMLAAHLYEVPAPLTAHRPEVPDDLQAVVLRCLAKAPGERFDDVARLDSALAACAVAGTWQAPDAQHWWRERR